MSYYGQKDRRESLFLLDMDQFVHQIQQDDKGRHHEEIATADFT